jgi:hypothetical protein
MAVKALPAKAIETGDSREREARKHIGYDACITKIFLGLGRIIDQINTKITPRLQAYKNLLFKAKITSIFDILSEIIYS